MMSTTKNMSQKETVIFIGGMTCQSCVRHIESILTQKAGVKLVRVGLEQQFGFIRYDPALTSPTVLAAVVDDIGFEASVDDCDTLNATWITVSGMTCQSCVRHIEGMVYNVTGVRSVHVSLSDSLATVIYDSLQTSASNLCDVINDLGFDAELLTVTAGDDLTGSISAAAASEVSESGDEFAKLAATRTIAGQQMCEISVEGMTCNSCVRNIESSLSSVAGVISVCVLLDQKKAIVVFNPVEISPETVAEKIDDMGFEVAVLVNRLQAHFDADKTATLGHSQPSENGKPDDVQHSAVTAGQMTTQLSVSGMHCQSCVRAIEGHLKSIFGVVSVNVNLDRELCRVVHNPSCVSAETLRQAVESAGNFKASFSGKFMFWCCCINMYRSVFLAV